nr:integrase, catalytic region, zinc finger, CCHC-type, peptidase aspartic, catalytic [Tanacetum cinerariifolium]
LVHTARTRRPQPKGNTKNAKVPSASKSSEVKKIVTVEDRRRTLLLFKNRANQKRHRTQVVQICLWCVDSGCSKHMTGNIKLLINFVWKFLGTVCFGNDHIAAILGYGDLKWGNITITRVYFVEGLGHNLFSAGQFCDADLEVAFRRNTCFIRDLDGVDLLKANRSINLYTVNLYDMASASPICLMAHATPTKTKDETPEVIKNFLKKMYVRLQAPVIIVRTDNGMEFKNQVLKEYFDSVGITHETSAAKTPQQNRVVEYRNRTLVEAAITMLIFSHAPLFLWAEAIATACYTQNCSIIHQRFNKTPYELIQGRKPDISYLHVFGALCYPKNDREDIGKLGAKGDIGFFIGYSANYVAYKVYNQRTRKIMETMNVTFDELSVMVFEQNGSRPGLQNMTSGQISSELELTYAPSTITPQRPSERDLDILFEPLHNEFLCGRPSEAPRVIPAAPVLQNLQAPTASMSFQDSAPAEAIATACYTHNRSIIHRRFNKTPYDLIQGRKPDISYLYVFWALCYSKNDHEDIAMAFEQNSSRPGLQSMTSRQISSELELTYAMSTITPQRPSERDLDILFEPLHNEFLGGRPAKAPRDSAPVPTNSSNTSVSSHNVDVTSQQHAQQQRNLTSSPTVSAADNVLNAGFEGDLFVNPFGTPSTVSAISSTQYVDPLNMHIFYQPYPHDYQWTKDHPLEQVIGEPS